MSQIAKHQIQPNAIDSNSVENDSLTSLDIKDGTIVNADISAEANIDIAKLGSTGATSGDIIRFNGLTWTITPPSGMTWDSPEFTGIPLAPTANMNTRTTQIATTAFVLSHAGSLTPIMNGTASQGTSFSYARQDHVHPTDTNRQPVDPTLTALSGLTLSSDKLLLVTGTSSVTVGQLSDAYIASNAAIAITKLGTTGAAIEDVIYYNGTNLTFGKTPIVPLEPYATNTTPASTTLTTYQTYQSFTTPTLRAKTYKVSWNFRCNYSSNKDNMSARIIVDGTTVLWEIVIPFPKTLTRIRYPVTGFAFITFTSADTHSINLDYMAGAAGTASMYDSVISITEVRTA